MKCLDSKTVVITGAGRGIGQAIAQRFAAEGARLILISRNPDSCGSTADAINGLYPDSCKAFPCDVSDAAAVEACIKEILAEYPSIDVLVNNAGITRDGLLMRMKEADWDAVMDTNLKSVFLFCKGLMRNISKSSAGRIINMGSVVGVSGNMGQANYAASKAGLIGFTKSLAQELAGRGVACNVIAPGFIETEMTDAIPEKAREAILSKIPMAGMGRTEDIAGCALFLASDAARYVTGQVLCVDGGMCM